MKRRKRIIYGSVIILLVIAIAVAYYYFQKPVTIYEPVTIKLSDVAKIDGGTVDLFGMTPLDREIHMSYSETLKTWNLNYTFLRSVHLVIDDTLAKKVTSVEVIIGQNTFMIAFNELKAIKSSGDRTEYVLPSNICSVGSWAKKAFSILHWNSFRLFIEILLSLSLLLVLVFFGRKYLKKKNLSFHIVVANIRNSVEQYPRVRIIWLWMKIILLSVLIACTLFFGFLLVAFTLSTYITSLFFIFYSGLFFLLISRLILKKSGKSDICYRRFRMALLIIIVIWFCIETGLRIKGINAGKNESDKLFYITGFHKRFKSDIQSPDLLVNARNSRYADRRKEFSFEIISNNEGLRDRDHEIKKQKDEYRIICVGNSFTEGIGTPQDSTWPKLLEDRLNMKSKKKVTIINAGKAGSDPFFGYKLFEKRMLKYNPDLVLLAISSSDFNFYRFRGGFERFTPEGYQFREAPWWEPFYAVSFIFRFITDDIMHYQYFLTPEEYASDSIKAMNDINDCIHRFYKLSFKRGFAFEVVICDDNIYKLDPVVNSLKKENMIPIIDLAEYSRNIEKLTGKNREGYYWPLDGHCNSRGYLMFARGVYWNLNKMGIIDSLNIK